MDAPWRFTKKFGWILPVNECGPLLRLIAAVDAVLVDPGLRSVHQKTADELAAAARGMPELSAVNQVRGGPGKQHT